MIRRNLLALAAGDPPVTEDSDDGDSPPDEPTPDVDERVERHDPEFGERIIRVAVGFDARVGVDYARMASVGDGHDIRYHYIDAVDFEIPESQVADLRSKPGIRYVERDRIESEDATGWHIDRTDTKTAWSNGVTGEGATIAIVDTGCDPSHPGLAANISRGHAVVECDPSVSFTDCQEPWDDDRGHGTKVAGMAAGTNAEHETGVAPDAEILPVKVLDSNGTGTKTDSSAGIEWAANHGADVINCSFGGSSYSTTQSEAVSYARAQGAVVIASAGNSGPCTDCVNYPGAYADDMAISASNKSDGLASFSSQGPDVDLIAPGVDCYTTQLEGLDGTTYATFSGTSASTPVVSGVAALLVQQGTTAPGDIETQLKSTAEDIGLTTAEQGSGLVDAQAATVTDEYVAVTTNDATNVAATSATLHGNVDELVHNGNGAEVWFEYWSEDAGGIQETPRQTVTTTGAFSASVSGLTHEAEYGFQARAETVIDGASAIGTTRTFETPFDFGDPTDPDTWLLTTDLNGEVTESLPADPEYSFATDFTGYQIEKGTFEHRSSGVTNIYLVPPGGDGSVAGPETAAHFEVAVLADRTTEQFQIPVRVNNVATNTGTYQLTFETAGGQRLDQRELTLRGGEWKHVMMSCRSAFADGSDAADVVVRTTHDEEHLTITSGGVVAPVASEGRPATLGGSAPATLGNPVPATLGHRRDYPDTDDPDLVQIPGAYGLTLENAAGRRLHIEHVGEFSLDLKHTDFSQWSVSVPADLELPNWTHRTKAYITRDERTIVEGWVDPITLQSSDQSGTVAGYTGTFEWTRGDDVTLNFRGEIPEYKAIERALRAVAPEWDTTVVPAADPVRIDPGEISGAPFGVLEQLCDDYGYHWLDDERRLQRVVFFPPGALHANKRFDSRLAEFDISREGGSFAPWVKAVGDGVTGEYVDEAAVERIAREQNLSWDDAKGKPRTIEVDAETNAEARALARGEYRKLAGENEISGTIDLPAERLQPGVAYPMPWDEATVHGVYSLRLRSGGRVTLPGQTMFDLRNQGAITLWCRADWPQLDHNEVRLIAGSHLGTPGGIRTVNADNLDLIVDGREVDTGTRVSAYPGERPPANEWLMLNYDWSFDSAENETTVRAGHGGEMRETATLRGRPQIPRVADDLLWIGAHYNHHFRGEINRLTMFTNPLSDDEYRRLAAEETIPATDLHARWTMDEGPHDASNVVRDIVGGYHGTPENIEYSGSPQMLESLSVDGSDATAKFSREVSMRSNLEQLRKEQQKSRRKQ